MLRAGLLKYTCTTTAVTDNSQTIETVGVETKEVEEAMEERVVWMISCVEVVRDEESIEEVGLSSTDDADTTKPTVEYKTSMTLMLVACQVTLTLCNQEHHIHYRTVQHTVL